MRILDLGKYRRARFWIGEMPEAACLFQQTIERTFHADRAPNDTARMAAVEIFVPLGARSMYGLIGGQFQPDYTDCLTVEVGIASSTERLFVDSIATKTDVVRAGLPAEYAEAVLAGVDLAKKQLSTLAAGKLSINCAAHGAAGSCDVIYKHLTAILIKVISAERLGFSDAELIDLFPASYD